MINYLFALVLGGTILGVSFLTGDLFNRVSKLTPAPVVTYAPIATLIPFDQPTASPKKIVKIVATTNPDPIVNCTFSHLSSMQMTLSKCKSTVECQIDRDKWIITYSKDECSREVKSYIAKTYPTTNYTPYPVVTTKYVPCAIFYPTTGVEQTYNYTYTSEQECTNEQLRLNAEAQEILDSYNQLTPTTNAQNSQLNAQCKDDAQQWYTNQVTQYGSGTAEAVSQIILPQYQAKVSQCNQQYPL